MQDVLSDHLRKVVIPILVRPRHLHQLLLGHILFDIPVKCDTSATGLLSLALEINSVTMATQCQSLLFLKQLLEVSWQLMCVDEVIDDLF